MACSVGVKNLLHANHNHYTKEGRMSRILFFAMSLVLLSGAVAWADGGPVKGAADTKVESSLMFPHYQQTWSMPGTPDRTWMYWGKNEGGGIQRKCVGNAGNACTTYSFQVDHPAGWTPADDGKSTIEWVQVGIVKIVEIAAEEGVVIPDEVLNQVEYTETFIPD